ALPNESPLHSDAFRCTADAWSGTERLIRGRRGPIALDGLRAFIPQRVTRTKFTSPSVFRWRKTNDNRHGAGIGLALHPMEWRGRPVAAHDVVGRAAVAPGAGGVALHPGQELPAPAPVDQQLHVPHENPLERPRVALAFVSQDALVADAQVLARPLGGFDRVVEVRLIVGLLIKKGRRTDERALVVGERASADAGSVPPAVQADVVEHFSVPIRQRRFLPGIDGFGLVEIG